VSAPTGRPRASPDPAIEITVVTTTYNRAQLLPRAWKSIQGQPAQLEWIVVDDGSSDDTREVVESFRDDRIAYVPLERNTGGPAVGRNRGAAMARGRYVVFLDDDDELYPGVLRKMVDTMDGADATVGGALFQCRINGVRSWREKIEDGAVYDEEDVVCGRVLGMEKIIVYRREVFDEFRLPEDLRFMESLFVFGLTRRYRLLMSAAPGRIYHLAGGQYATDVKRTIAMSRLIAIGYERILENHRRVLSTCPRARDWYMLKAQYRFGVAGDRAGARRMLGQLLREGSAGARVKALAFGLLSEARVIRTLERLRLPFALQRRVAADGAA
jgi:glycosyltransferase involved in cell wall biosynthesis